MASTEQILIFLTVFLVLSLSRTLAKRDFQIVFEKINCVGTKDYIDNAICSSIRAPPPSSISIDFIIKKVVNDFRMDLIVNLNRANGGSFTALKVQEVEPCTLFETKTSIPVYNMIMESLKRSGTVPKCPIPALYHYKLTNMTIDPELLPQRFPQQALTVMIGLFDKRVSFLNITVKGRAVYSKNKQRKPK